MVWILGGLAARCETNQVCCRTAARCGRLFLPFFQLLSIIIIIVTCILSGIQLSVCTVCYRWWLAFNSLGLVEPVDRFLFFALFFLKYGSFLTLLSINNFLIPIIIFVILFVDFVFFNIHPSLILILYCVIKLYCQYSFIHTFSHFSVFPSFVAFITCLSYQSICRFTRNLHNRLMCRRSRAAAFFSTNL